MGHVLANISPRVGLAEFHVAHPLPELTASNEDGPSEVCVALILGFVAADLDIECKDIIGVFVGTDALDEPVKIVGSASPSLAIKDAGFVGTLELPDSYGTLDNKLQWFGFRHKRKGGKARRQMPQKDL